MAMTKIELARSSGLVGRRLNTRAKLVEAARRVFRSLGYEATTVADIVAAADVSRPTFYLYFSGKQDVYRAIGTELALEGADRFRALDAVLSSGGSGALRAWLDEHAEWARHSSWGFTLWSEAEAHDPAVSNEIWRVTVSEWLDEMPRFVAQWPPEDHLEPFTRFALLLGQLRFFHHPLLTAAERRVALDVLTETWWAQLHRVA